MVNTTRSHILELSRWTLFRNYQTFSVFAETEAVALAWANGRLGDLHPPDARHATAGSITREGVMEAWLRLSNPDPNRNWHHLSAPPLPTTDETVEMSAAAVDAHQYQEIGAPEKKKQSWDEWLEGANALLREAEAGQG